MKGADFSFYPWKWWVNCDDIICQMLSLSKMSNHFEGKLSKLEESTGCSENSKDFYYGGEVYVVRFTTFQPYWLNSEKALLSFDPDLSKVQQSGSPKFFQMTFGFLVFLGVN